MFDHTGATRTSLRAAIALALAAAPAAQAATLVVTTPGDSDPGSPGTCTLRQAIASVNTATLRGNCQRTGAAFGTNDTITFASGIDTITLADAHDNQLMVLASVTIDAGAGRTVTVERPAGASNRFSVFGITGDALDVRLAGLTVRGGEGNGDFTGAKYASAGAMWAHGIGTNLTIERSTIRDNHADTCGAIFVGVGGSLTVRDSRITNNSSRHAAGAILSYAPVSIESSLIDGNDAWEFAGAILAADALRLVDSTLSGNTAPAGSAIGTYMNPPNITVLNSTIACNSGGATLDLGESTFGDPPIAVSFFSSILANTGLSGCAGGSGPEIHYAGSAPLSVGGDHVLLGSASAIDASATFATTPVFGDPLLGPLQDNGGPTPTHALLAGSPAINAGSNPANLAWDQRGSGFPRQNYNRPDIGAFELPYAGLCGSANGQSFASMSAGTPNLCAAGAVLQGGPFGTGPWSWFCALPSDPVNNNFCSASVLAGVTVGVTDPAGTPIGSAVYGQPIEITANVAGSAGAPTGTVSFFDATFGPGVLLCATVPLAGGIASCPVSGNMLASGGRLVRAVYGGNGTYGSASANGPALTIDPATSTIVPPANVPVVIGTPYAVVAYVHADAPSLAAPTGELVITDQTDGLSCSYPLGVPDPGCTITPLTTGQHDLIVTYAGDGNVLPSSAGAIESVLHAESTTTVAPLAAIPFGASVDVYATVAGTPTAGTPSGTVSVSTGTASCGFDVASETHCTLTPDSHGALEVTVSYPGDPHYAPSGATTGLDVVPHTVGGSVTGLLPGNEVTLRLDYDAGGSETAIVGGTAFAFGAAVRVGASYAVAVVAQPANPEQACTVANGSGSMPADDVTNVVVDCVEQPIFANGFDA